MKKKSKSSPAVASPVPGTLGEIQGFRPDAKKTSTGRTDTGRFTCSDVQLTGIPPDGLATFTITADQLHSAAANGILWTDQDVQRGIKPESASLKPPRELSLANGYPDPALYIFVTDNADEIAEKLLSGNKVFLDPLIWNLRPNSFEAYWDPQNKCIHIYSGKIYLPDSHHRQQGILKAVRTWETAKSEYPNFNGSREFTVQLYFLSREDEGNYFFDKNQRPRPTAKSKAFDLTTQDDLSLLAKKVIEKSVCLKDNVNRVTDRLTAKNPQVITLSTLREMMRSFVDSDVVDNTEFEGLSQVAAQFLDILATARPELGQKTATERRAIRNSLLVDSAVMMHGYVFLLKEFYRSLATLGLKRAERTWKEKLDRLRSSNIYTFSGSKWRGDIFDKKNPLWEKIGITKLKRSGVNVLNTGGARSHAGRTLVNLMDASAVADLSFLAK